MKCIPNHPSILQASENVSTSYPLHLILDDMTGFLNVHLFEMFTSQAQSQLNMVYYAIYIWHFSQFLIKGNSNCHGLCTGWKEFPDTRQNDSRIEFIRAGDAVRTESWLTGEPTPFMI